MVERIRWWRSTEPGLARVCLSRVLRKRCPQCGLGRLFRAWARLSDRCEVCGLVYRREPGAELGAMMLASVLNTGIAAAAFLVVWTSTDMGGLTAFWLVAPIVLLACYSLAPWCMSIWVAVEYLTDVGNGEWWARRRR